MREETRSRCGSRKRVDGCHSTGDRRSGAVVDQKNTISYLVSPLLPTERSHRSKEIRSIKGSIAESIVFGLPASCELSCVARPAEQACTNCCGSDFLCR